MDNPSRQVGARNSLQDNPGRPCGPGVCREELTASRVAGLIRSDFEGAGFISQGRVGSEKKPGWAKNVCREEATKRTVL